MSKQTAVEWLIDKLPSLFVDDSGHYKKLFEQARQREKEQIITAYRVGKVEATLTAEKLTTGNQYYNETYKENDKN